MSQTIVNTINKVLNEEQWTRLTINDYTSGSFEELSDIVDKSINENIQDEVLELCNEHLATSKDSIAALFISGVISLRKQLVDDTRMLNLVSIFSDSQKWKIVEYLCNHILLFGENKVVLRILADTLEHQGRLEEMYDIWERLIKVDYTETDLVKRLAETFEKENNIEKAVFYYKKAINRFVGNNKFNQVKALWEKPIEYGVDDYDFYFLIIKKVSKSMNIEKAIELLEELYPSVRERGEINVAIDILKRILEFDGKNNWARQEIIQCYREKYSEHSQLDEYILLSNLNHNWRHVQEAIADFEKHISFDEGSFVFHKSWGVGRIKAIKGDNILIDFAKKRNHSMQLKMAVGALQSLSNNHIWVLKSIHSREKLKEKIKKDKAWALKTIIQSFNNVADMKKIKAELVPTILSQGEWSTWSNECRKTLKDDPAFGNLPDKIDQYVVRDKPMSKEEKTFNQFKAEKTIFGKIQAAREFLVDNEPDSDFFGEMLNYFNSFLMTGNATVEVVASYLFLAKLSEAYPYLSPSIDWGFRELWNKIPDKTETFKQLQDLELREDFLVSIRRNVENWVPIYLTLFPVQLSHSMLDELMAFGAKKDVQDKLEDIIDHYREYRDGLLWIAKENAGKRLGHFKFNPEKIIINLIRLYDLTFIEIDNKQEVSQNRKHNRQLQTFLFKEKNLENYLLGENRDSAVRVYALLDDIRAMDPLLKRDIKTKLINTYDGIRFYGDSRVTGGTAPSSSSRYFYTTQKSLQEKQKELKHIIDIEIPRNSREIGAAIELGDLSENAEYKAGKEKQENLQIQVGKLKDEIERARIFSDEDRHNSKVTYASKIILEDMVSLQEDSYTLLGPWESKPAEKIISYLSPFGSEFMGKEKGDVLDFMINDRSYKYRILEIQAVDII